MSLLGKTALVTGGARRVGRAIVEELARAGCRVVIHYGSSDADAAALAGALATADYTPAVVKADLREHAAARAVVDAAVAATGRLDILVNSAAAYARTPLSTMNDDAWDEMFALNLGAPPFGPAPTGSMPVAGARAVYGHSKRHP